ncbi:uncharacterized protein [Coffea arabica]|uniref:Uncharacterized protein n=1 Tax=Coffea arabica TaxID=13443 RepID=A0ABM4UCQ8_COFAR
MEGSENSKIENRQKVKIGDGSEQVEVQEVDFGEVIELPPEPAAMHNEPVIVAEEKNTMEQSGSSEVTVEEKGEENLSVISEPEATVRELAFSEYGQKQDGVSAVASEAETKTQEEAPFPISSTSVAESSGVRDSISEKNVVELSEPVAVVPGDATNGGGGRDSSENPSSTDREPAAVLTPHTRTFWTSCCGLFDALRGSNQ